MSHYKAITVARADHWLQQAIISAIRKTEDAHEVERQVALKQ